MEAVQLNTTQELFDFHFPGPGLLEQFGNFTDSDFIGSITLPRQLLNQHPQIGVVNLLITNVEQFFPSNRYDYGS